MSSVWSRLSAVFGAALAMGTLVWSGCGNGESRYYCDDTGCYSCDAYGCGAVTPPSSAPCTGNTSCGAGQVCTSGGCTATCSSDGDCPKGDVCKGNYCVAPTNPAPTAKECTTAAECPAGNECDANKCVPIPDAGGPSCSKGSDCSSGQACVAGHCHSCGGANGPCACSGDTDCTGTDVCIGGVCTAPSNGCKYSSDCGDANKICVDGRCETSCTSTCATGFTCVKGGCSPNPTGTPCTSPSNCSGTTPFCVDGQCAAACTGDAQCPAGDYCNGGACVPDTRPKTNCQSDAQCNSGGPSEKCVGGICKYTCSADADCKAIDTRIQYCASDKVCRTFDEAHPACTSKAQCAAGQDCVGNKCL